MKNILLFIVHFFITASFSQTAIFNKVKEESTFSEYISRSGQSIKINDTIQIGYPGNGSLYNFITQGNQPAAAQISNSKAVITKIRSVGNSKRGYKIYVLFSGYGLLPVYVDYEAALETGEIKGVLNKNQ